MSQMPMIRVAWSLAPEQAKLAAGE